MRAAKRPLALSRSDPASRVPDDGEEFPAGRRVVAEGTQHAARHHADAWFADTARCHALVCRFDNDADMVKLGILNLYQRHLEPVRAAIIYTLEPVWATLYGLALGLVGWTPWILVGGGLLVVGNLMVELTSQDEEE